MAQYTLEQLLAYKAKMNAQAPAQPMQQAPAQPMQPEIKLPSESDFQDSSNTNNLPEIKIEPMVAQQQIEQQTGFNNSQDLNQQAAAVNQNNPKTVNQGEDGRGEYLYNLAQTDEEQFKKTVGTLSAREQQVLANYVKYQNKLKGTPEMGWLGNTVVGIVRAGQKGRMAIDQLGAALPFVSEETTNRVNQEIKEKQNLMNIQDMVSNSTARTVGEYIPAVAGGLAGTGIKLTKAAIPAITELGKEAAGSIAKRVTANTLARGAAAAGENVLSTTADLDKGSFVEQKLKNAGEAAAWGAGTGLAFDGLAKGIKSIHKEANVMPELKEKFVKEISNIKQNPDKINTIKILDDIDLDKLPKEKAEELRKKATTLEKDDYNGVVALGLKAKHDVLKEQAKVKYEDLRKAIPKDMPKITIDQLSEVNNSVSKIRQTIDNITGPKRDYDPVKAWMNDYEKKAAKGLTLDNMLDDFTRLNQNIREVGASTPTGIAYSEIKNALNKDIAKVGTPEFNAKKLEADEFYTKKLGAFRNSNKDVFSKIEGKNNRGYDIAENGLIEKLMETNSKKAQMTLNNLSPESKKAIKTKYMRKILDGAVDTEKNEFNPYKAYQNLKDITKKDGDKTQEHLNLLFDKDEKSQLKKIMQKLDESKYYDFSKQRAESLKDKTIGDIGKDIVLSKATGGLSGVINYAPKVVAKALNSGAKQSNKVIQPIGRGAGKVYNTTRETINNVVKELSNGKLDILKDGDITKLLMSLSNTKPDSPAYSERLGGLLSLLSAKTAVGQDED